MTMPPWSYTALDCFENCPKQYHSRYVLKRKSPETEQTKHGTEVHGALELRVRDGKPLPEAYRGYEPLAGAIAKQKDLGRAVTCEMPLAIDKEFKPCDFFGKNVWGRGKADLVVRNDPKAWVGDWKTGKVREKEFQVKIFAAFIFKMLPQIQTVTANNIWLAADKLGQTYTFERHQEPAIWNEILHKINRIELAFEKDAFNAKPSGLCGWCEVLDCPYNPKGGR